MVRNCLTVFLFILYSPAAFAGFVFSFGQSNYQVAPNQTLNVEVFLQQDTPAGDPVNLADVGIISGGVNVFFNMNAPSQPAIVSSLADITPNLLFNDTLLGEELFLVPGVSAGFVDGVDFFSPPLTGSKILLGTIRFTAGANPGDITTLLATDLRAGEDIIAGDIAFTPLDSFVGSGQATITVSAVPEPGSFVLLAIGASVAAMARKRRQSVN
jgi:PEP-CTERM motif